MKRIIEVLEIWQKIFWEQEKPPGQMTFDQYKLWQQERLNAAENVCLLLERKMRHDPQGFVRELNTISRYPEPIAPRCSATLNNIQCDLIKGHSGEHEYITRATYLTNSNYGKTKIPNTE